MATGRGTRLDTLYYELEARVNGLEVGKAKAVQFEKDFGASGARAGANFAEGIVGHINTVEDALQSAGQGGTAFAKTLLEAATTPIAALGLLAAALVTVAAGATKAAAEFDTAFRGITSTIDGTGLQFDTLRSALSDLSTETPRTATSLAEVAGEIAKMGETDPAQIAADVRTLALAGDALGKTDLKPLAETLDLLGDGFNLTAQQAREAFTQIAAITHGKIDMDEFAGVLEKSGTRMHALGVSAQETASVITTLIDKGVNKRQVTSGLIDLLEKADGAEKAALDAADAQKEGTASALRTFAATVNASTISTQGLAGALGDLYRAFDGNNAQLKQAGLSITDISIAQKAAEATANGAKVGVLSYEESLAKLKASADVNNTSAAALSQVLKNDLSVVLIDLGNKFLPPLLVALTKLADLFNRTKSAASDAAADIKASAEAAARAAIQLGKGNGAEFRVEAATVVAQGSGAARKIVDHPAAVQAAGFDLEGTRAALVETQQFEALISKTHTSSQVLADALAIVNAQIKATGEAATTTAPKAVSVGKALDDEGTKAAAAADKFKELTRAALDFAESLGGEKDPLAAADAKIASLKATLDDTIKAMLPAKQAAARIVEGTILDQLADGRERLRVANLAAIGKEIDALTAKVAGGANAGIVAAFDAEIEKAQQLEAAAKKAGDAEKAFDAAVSVAKLTTQKNAAVDNANALKKLADAQDVVTRFLRESDNAALGVTVTYDQYRAALNTLIKTQREAEAIINDSAASDDEKTAAKKRLTDATNALNEVQGKSNTHLRQSVSSAELLGDGLSTAAASALTLLQLLGKSDSALARMASAAGSLGNGLSGLGKASNAKDAEGNPLTGAAKFAAFAGPAAQVIGGLTALAGSLDLFGNKAREQAKALRDSAVEFNRSLDAFAINVSTDLASALKANLAKANDLLKAAPGKSLDELAFGDKRAPITKSSDLDALIATATANGSDKSVAVGVREKILVYRDALVELQKTLIANETAIREANAKAIASGEDDIKVRALVAEGRLDEAQAMRDQLARQRELADATAKYAGTAEGDAYIQHLKDVQAEEKAAADAAARDPLKNFASQAKAFGLTGAEYLNGLIAATKKKFGEVADAALDGLDLSTQAGLDALQQHIHDLWTTFNADGIITDSEQQVIDSLGNIFTNASDIFDSLDKRIARSQAKVSDDNSILGGDARTQFGRTVDASKGFDSILDGILSGIDLTTSAGAEAFRAKLQEYYTSIASDGISATEQPIVDLIKTLLGGLQSTVEEATQEAEAASTKAETDRTARLAKRQGLAARDSALNDETGVAAVVSQINGLSEQLSDLFKVFDLQTPASITSAKDAIKALVKQVDSLSDPEVIAKFGVTRDELTNAILDLDNSLDGLANTAKSAAQAAVDLANAQADVTASSHDAFLRASGNDRQADIESAQAATAAKVQRAKDLNVSPAVIDEILRTGALTLAGINTRYDAQAAQATAQQAQQAASTATGTTSARDKFTASSVTSITEVQGLSLVGAVTTSNAILRTIDARLAAAFGAFPSVRVPALPAGLGGFGGSNSSGTNSGTSSGPVFNIAITVTGPVMGQSAGSAAQQMANELLPLISRGLARGAGLQAKLAGKTL